MFEEESTLSLWQPFLATFSMLILLHNTSRWIVYKTHLVCHTAQLVWYLPPCSQARGRTIESIRNRLITHSKKENGRFIWDQANHKFALRTVSGASQHFLHTPCVCVCVREREREGGFDGYHSITTKHSC